MRLHGVMRHVAATAVLLLLAAGSALVPTASAEEERRRFWVQDTLRYSSPWYAGERRKMIDFGCTRAPYYDPDPRCTDRRGFHHGLDLAMPCGTRLFAGFRGWVVSPDAPGALGPAFGAKAFRIRRGQLIGPGSWPPPTAATCTSRSARSAGGTPAPCVRTPT